jgi:uncharacterized protein YuzE
MTVTDVRPYLGLISPLQSLPQHACWSFYDPTADTLTVQFRQPGIAYDSNVTEDGIILRYDEEGEVVSFTIPQASKRQA